MSKIKILIADSGSTKTHWVLLDKEILIKEFHGEGMNAYVYSDDQLKNTVHLAKEELRNEISPAELYFYGAGCSTDANKKKIRNLLQQNGFSTCNITVEHDLLAAARALFNRSEGIACILGTGSSSCHINNGEIQHRLPSLGYVIGDEGGGFDLGSRLLRAVLKGQAPKEVIELFYGQYNMHADELISNIYSSNKPNKYVASFSTFLSKNLENEYCKAVVREAFTSFVNTDILAYKSNIPVGFVGSVAYVFQDILRDVLLSRNLQVGAIIQSPMKGLIAYHSADQR